MAVAEQLACPNNLEVVCPYRKHTIDMYISPATTDPLLAVQLTEKFGAGHDTKVLGLVLAEHSVQAKVRGCNYAFQDTCAVADAMATSKPRNGLKWMIRKVVGN